MVILVFFKYSVCVLVCVIDRGRERQTWRETESFWFKKIVL